MKIIIALIALINLAQAQQPLVKAAPTEIESSSVHFDGNHPMPFDKRFEIMIGNSSERYHLRFSTANTKDFHARLQQTIFLLKLDQGELTEREQEMGSIFVEYTDGHMAHVNFTSKKIDAIEGADFGYAVESSRILSQRKPKRIINLHTHPHPANPLLKGELKYIGPSLADYEQWLFVKERFSQMGVEDFEYLSIVIPSCDYCQDLAFVVDDEDLSFYKASN